MSARDSARAAHDRGLGQQLVETYDRIDGDPFEIAARSIESPHRGVSIRNRSCIFVEASIYKMQGAPVTRDTHLPLAAEFFAIAAAVLLGEVAISNAATPGEAETSGQLQEIIVTAQKRAEDIKDIPFSVSAISGAELAEHHIADYDDITRTVPGISFQAGPGPGLDNIEIRGVSSTSGSATVGVYIDEVSVTVSNSQYDGAVQPKLFDLDRIEVLRGPQGTLYGASSMGGTIRFITKQPVPHCGDRGRRRPGLPDGDRHGAHGRADPLRGRPAGADRRAGLFCRGVRALRRRARPPDGVDPELGGMTPGFPVSPGTGRCAGSAPGFC